MSLLPSFLHWYNIFNVALITRAFLFFAYPTKMSGDQVWIAKESIFGLGNDLAGVDGTTRQQDIQI